MRPAARVPAVLPVVQADGTDLYNIVPPDSVFRFRRHIFQKRMNERIVCLDIGDVRIGVAVSDPTGTIASPVEVIRRVGWGPDTQKIKSICGRYETNRILSGLPLNMDGTEGFQAEKVRTFCAQLEKAGLDVCFQDERLSTVSAESALLQDDVSRSDRKRLVDKVAAAFILQQWLDEKKEEDIS